MRKNIGFKNGKLKILQISDLQDTRLTSVDTLRFMDAALKSIRPDLIIFTGDQLDVAGVWGKGKRAYKNVETAIKNLFSVFEYHDVPFALTFGNHDCETGVPNEEQARIYARFGNCICFDETDDGRPDVGTFNIPVSSSDGKSTIMNIFVTDTHSSVSGRGFAAVGQSQIDCFTSIYERDGLPAINFRHIPPPEIYELLEEVPKGTKGALPAYRSRKGKFYRLNSSRIKDRGVFGETPSVPEDNKGEFDALARCGVFAVFCGHDHYNSFVGTLNGVDIGYCPGGGYSSYGQPSRAVRVFEFDENDVTNYRTYTVSRNEICRQPLAQPVKNFIYYNAPSCVEEAPSFALKCLPVIALIIILLIILSHFISIKYFLISVLGIAVIYAVFSALRNAILRRRLIKNFNRET